MSGGLSGLPLCPVAVTFHLFVRHTFKPYSRNHKHSQRESIVSKTEFHTQIITDL